jgi:hypothetical protein
LRARPECVVTVSPIASCSTSPRGVRISVPAQKHGEVVVQERG